MLNQLKVQTDRGDLIIQLDSENAPATTAYFMDCAQRGIFNNTRVFRIVTEANASMRQDARIEVVQFGVEVQGPDECTELMHEPTNLTGLSHKKWTVSAARFGVGQNYPSFFVCMRDEPVLDYGGTRHPDGDGFAAFGEVVDGFRVAEIIHGLSEPQETLEKEIKIMSVCVL